MGPMNEFQRSKVFETNYRLMQVKIIAECQVEHSAILWPSFNYQLLLRSLFCTFLSGRFEQVLLYLSDLVQSWSIATISYAETKSNPFVPETNGLSTNGSQKQ